MADISNVTKPCIECGNCIHVDALKCSFCSSYQDWRRHLTTTNTFSGIILTLFGVIGTLLTLNLWSSDFSNTKLEAYSNKTSSAFYATNNGTKQSRIGRANYSFLHRKDSNQSFDISLEFGPPEDAFVPANSEPKTFKVDLNYFLTNHFELNGGTRIPAEVREYRKNFSCSVKIEVLEYGESEARIEEFNFPAC